MWSKLGAHPCKSLLLKSRHQLVEGVQLLPLACCHKSTVLSFVFLELWITLKDSYWWKSEACGQAGTSLGFPKFPPSFCCSWLLPSCFLSHRCLCLFPLSLLWNWCTYPDLQTWCFSFVISTEGVRRLSTTHDNHPIQPIQPIQPIHSIQPTKPL